MNKKFARVLSFILSVMMIFSCAIVASADGAPIDERITVTVRVEGLTKQLDKKTVVTDKSSTVKSIIDAAEVNVVYEMNSVTDIYAVKGETEATYSEWQYAVNGAIKTDAIDALRIDESCEIVLYNASPDAVFPTVDAEEVELSGVITFTGKDKDGVVAPIKDLKVQLETKSGDKVFTTDKSGKIYLSEEDLQKSGTSYSHDIAISKTNDYNVPVVVRLDKNAEVEIPEYNGTSQSDRTLFEQVYDFLYEILKGVIDVWVFYLSAIGGLFGIGA